MSPSPARFIHVPRSTGQAPSQRPGLHPPARSAGRVQALVGEFLEIGRSVAAEDSGRAPSTSRKMC
jgi:hypothetical protein